ncbi:MAG: Ku protein [Ramlibacter sp.]|nr:Ku protein [Ramlibacter sp.]
MASSASRVLWKGAISFGLVHIPVALHPATVAGGLDFDWLDKRSMDPVGYKRINKKTGKEVASANIVKGLEYEDGQYVVLSNEEISAAYPRATQTISIETFIAAPELPFLYLERPYYVAPINKGAKVYALLRETLRKTGRIGIARVVIQTREHLAALVPSGDGLVLNLLRWGDEIRPMEGLNLPPQSAKSAGLSERELKMAAQLVEDMSGEWKPESFRDLFRDEVMALVKRKVKAGETETVTPIEPQEPPGAGGAQIIDLTELLQRSLRKGDGKGAAQPAPPRKTARKTTRKAAARKATPARRKTGT